MGYPLISGDTLDSYLTFILVLLAWATPIELFYFFLLLFFSIYFLCRVLFFPALLLLVFCYFLFSSPPLLEVLLFCCFVIFFCTIAAAAKLQLFVSLCKICSSKGKWRCVLSWLDFLVQTSLGLYRVQVSLLINTPLPHDSSTTR